MTKNQPPDKEQPSLADLGLDGGDLPADPFGKALGDYDASGEDRPQTWTDHVSAEPGRQSSASRSVFPLLLLVAVVAAVSSLLLFAMLGTQPTLQESPKADVVVMETKIAPWKHAETGGTSQEILTTWRNAGDATVRLVNAEITTFDASGNLLGSFEYTLFAAFDDSPGVPPGATYQPKSGHGFKLPGYTPAANAKVRITEVAEHSGM